MFFTNIGKVAIDWSLDLVFWQHLCSWLLLDNLTYEISQIFEASMLSKFTKSNCQAITNNMYPVKYAKYNDQAITTFQTCVNFSKLNCKAITKSEKYLSPNTKQWHSI